MAGFAWLDWRQAWDAELSTARAVALDGFNKDLVYRRWVSMQGGVYVPPSESVPPNPYLSHMPERDVTTAEGKELTLVNPAYLVRLVYELGYGQYGLKGHITSLTPLRPGNAPDRWERDALEGFERGATEAIAIQRMDGASYLRFMKPLLTEESCLACHAFQGYSVGDVRGGISIAVPWEPYERVIRESRSSAVLLYSGVWLAGAALLIAFFSGLSASDRKRLEFERALEEGERKYRALFEESGDAIVWLDGATGRILRSNAAARGLYGLDERGLEALPPPQGAGPPGSSPIEGFSPPEGARKRFRIRRPDGSSRVIEAATSRIESRDTAVIQHLISDVTSQYESETAVLASLEAKETLLREVYHRTKNTMMMASSLIRLEASKYGEGSEVGSFARAADARIESLALVHRKLYEAKDLSSVNLGEYCGELARLIVGDFESGAYTGLSLDIDDARLSVDTAIPFALALNELLTNTMKYAHPAGERGEIALRIAVAEGKVHAEYADDGKGIPEGFDWRASKSLGFQLIGNLIEGQLGGHVEVGKGPGFRCDLEFPAATF